MSRSESRDRCGKRAADDGVGTLSGADRRAAGPGVCAAWRTALSLHEPRRIVSRRPHGRRGGNGHRLRGDLGTRRSENLGQLYLASRTESTAFVRLMQISADVIHRSCPGCVVLENKPFGCGPLRPFRSCLVREPCADVDPHKVGACSVEHSVFACLARLRIGGGFARRDQRREVVFVEDVDQVRDFAAGSARSLWRPFVLPAR